jgi:hypothetical protein
MEGKKILFGIKRFDKMYDVIILLKGHYKLGDIAEDVCISGVAHMEDKIDAFLVKNHFPKQFNNEKI